MKRTLLIDTAASGDTKTGESRTVNLPAAVAEELVAHIEDWTPDALIFPGPRGAMIQAGNFRNRVLSPASDRAGIPGLTPNDVRHSAVSWAISLGASQTGASLPRDLPVTDPARAVAVDDDPVLA